MAITRLDPRHQSNPRDRNVRWNRSDTQHFRTNYSSFVNSYIAKKANNDAGTRLSTQTCRNPHLQLATASPNKRITLPVAHNRTRAKYGLRRAARRMHWVRPQRRGAMAQHSSPALNTYRRFATGPGLYKLP